MRSPPDTQDQLSPTGPPAPRGRSSASIRWRWVATMVLLALILLAALYVPVPVFYAYLPGPVRDVERLVEVDNAQTYSSEGNLYLTTVSVDTNVTFAEWLEALFDSTTQIVGRDEVTGGQSFDQLEEQQRVEMQLSKQQAEEIALTELGYDPPSGDGSLVVDTLPESPAGGVLKRDDIIVGVDGRRIETTCDASRLIGSRHPGDVLRLDVKRDGRVRTIEVTAAESPTNPGSAYLGVLMKTKGYQFDPGVDVKFKTGDIAGPSAGLMFTLALYDRLTPGDLTGGAAIAGTGTVRCGGEIGAIGGIQQKIAGAEAEGAEIFLAPAQNYDDAVAAASDIEVVKVNDFDDALKHLEGLGN